jgi:uncharacterized membrane protein
MKSQAPDAADRHFPIAAGIFFGLGLGGFFDGIVLHQVLQWHHMLSSWYPITSIENLELNTFWDGIFHSSTYLFVIIGLFLLWHVNEVVDPSFWIYWDIAFIIWGIAMLVGGWWLLKTGQRETATANLARAGAQR